MYNPTEDIRIVREKLHEWSSKMQKMLDKENFNEVFHFICRHIDDIYFPVIDIHYYKELLEGWKIMSYQNRLKKEYPKHFRQILVEERKREKERIIIVKEDDNEIL